MGKIENSYQKIENGCAGRLLDDDPTPEVEALAPRAMTDVRRSSDWGIDGTHGLYNTCITAPAGLLEDRGRSDVHVVTEDRRS